MKVQVICSLVALAGAAASASAQGILAANAFNMEFRNFNDYPSSHISNLTAPGQDMSTEIIENMNPPGTMDPQKYANRHFANFSADGGATALGLLNSQSFQVSYNMTMTTNINNDGSGQQWPNQPEGGLFFRNLNQNNGSPYYDEGGIFVVGNGVVFIGGANMKFSLISNNGWKYGDNLFMRYQYYAPGVIGAEAAYRVYFANLTSGFTADTGVVGFDPGNPNENGLQDGSIASFRYQNTRNPLVPGGTITDTAYNNIQVVPGPAGASVLALAGLVASRRRRS